MPRRESRSERPRNSPRSACTLLEVASLGRCPSTMALRMPLLLDELVHAQRARHARTGTGFGIPGSALRGVLSYPPMPSSSITYPLDHAITLFCASALDRAEAAPSPRSLAPIMQLIYSHHGA